MNTIGAASVFILLTIKSVAGIKPDYWHAPLLTLGQVKDHLVIGQTREDVLHTIPFNVGAQGMPSSGWPIARSVMFFPKNEDSIVFTQGLWCRFEDDSGMLKEAETWNPRYIFYIQLRKLYSLRKDLIGSNGLTRMSKPPWRKKPNNEN